MNTKANSILILDDDEQLSDVLSLSLESDGYAVDCCSTLAQGLRTLARTPGKYSTLLVDLRLPDGNGLDVLPKIRELAPDVPVFIITAHGDVDSAVTAFTRGATGYIKKPFQDGELKSQIAQAIENFELRKEVQSLKNLASLSESHDVRSIIKSRDPVMEPLLRKITMAAQVNSNVVITGESGTGKELVARALHRAGPRKNAPFVAFNCAAVPENLLESELFGYVRGAFTDARDNKPGLFTRAQGGTLFLDEIGDAPLSIQAKLLRVLQEREVLPLGGTSPIKIDVRVVAASHKSLQEEAQKGTFRQDLFYRLHVLPIQVPALRERKKDIIFLASLFAHKICKEMGVEFGGFRQSAQESLESYAWPGNVRELQNRIEHALVIEGGGKLSGKSFFPEKEWPQEQDAASWAQDPVVPDPLVESVAPTQTKSSLTVKDAHVDEVPLVFHSAKSQFEREYLLRLLNAARGNIAKAARLAEKSRTEVYGLLKKHGLEATEFKSNSGSSNA